jgi:hypothetical protein
MNIEMFPRNKDDEYREAELTSEGERAELLLESGYSKRQLRSAMRMRHRQLDDNDSYSNNEAMRKRIPSVILSGPARIGQKIADRAKWLWPSPSLVEQPTFFY